ncbi:MAG TPA: ATP-binding cassette domain-containing protein, partial [Candidatus Cloacimonetes bacterium]|nr:ATP-binding cassette domain-containing protein [Candidatus Cloacimonadota bacterium]
MIKINDLTISFGEHTVLQNINLQILKNRITTIVGASGCGKSVLMKAIEGLIIPDSGNIEIDGENLLVQNRDGVRRIRKKIAMLFQGAALLDSLTVYQNVALPLKEHTKKNDKEIYRIVEEKLNLVGLKNVMSKMPSELSGGMKK